MNETLEGSHKTHRCGMVTGHRDIRLRESGLGIKQRRKRDDNRGSHSEIVSAEYLHSEVCSYHDHHRATRIASRDDPGLQRRPEGRWVSDDDIEW